MPKKLLLFLMLLFTICCFSQEGRKNILGKIVSDSIGIKNVHIFNMTSRKGTISNAYGEFQIPVKENDTLLISDIQYQSQKIIIDETHLSSVQLFISLKLNINELNEVELKDHDLSGNLKNDAKNTAYTDNMNEELKKPGAWKVDMRVIDDIDDMDREKAPDSRKLTDPTEQATQGGLIGLLTSLGIKTIINEASKIGRKKRMKKREQKIYNEKALVAPEAIRNELGDSFFVATLKIPAQYIDDFIKYCDNKGVIEKYLKGNKIETIDILIKQSEVYLKNLKDEN